MPKIWSPKEGTKVYRKKILYNGKTFLLTIYDSSGIVTLFLGGRNIYCIEASVYKKDTPLTNIAKIDANIGNFFKLEYDIECAVDSTFARGSDTKSLVKIMCSIIKSNYPYVTKLKFNDASTKLCDNGDTVELPLMNYLIGGETWYEYNFEAQLDDETEKKLLEEEQKFNEIKKTLKWNTLLQFITAKLPLDEKELETIYNQTDNWQDFFSYISKKIKIADFCMFISSWVKKFMLEYMKFNFAHCNYYLPIDKNIVKYTMVNYNTGGKRRPGRTQKAKKRITS
jgi:hypothetical protein